MSTGIFTSNNLTANLPKPSFASMITRLMPNGTAPLFGITSMLGVDTAVQTEHGFFTKTMLFPQLTLAASATSTDTTLTVTTTTNVLPNMIMRVNSTGENVIINTVLSAISVSVTRGVGNIAAQAISNSVDLYQVGNAFEEASARPNALIINPVKITNLTQIFRNTWAISDTIRETMMIAGDTNVAESRMDCAAFHAADIEKALIFGQKAQGTRNGQPFRLMDGAVSIVTNTANYPSIYGGVANVTTFGSTTTYTQFETATDPMFNQATDPKVANQRLLFVGGTAKKALNNIGRLNGTYFIENEQTSWGLQFSTYKIARGTFTVIEHPLLNTNSTWAKMVIGLDLSTFRLAYLGNRRTRYEPFGVSESTTDFGMDADGGTLTTEVTCVMKNPPANFIGFNLTAGAAG
jgi:hypothetical protein